jgi:hypothetical protein
VRLPKRIRILEVFFLSILTLWLGVSSGVFYERSCPAVGNLQDQSCSYYGPIANWLLEIRLSDVLLIFFTAVLAFKTAGLDRATRGLQRAAIRQDRATRKSLKFADDTLKQSADSTERQLRAYVFAKEVNFRIDREPDHMGAYGPVKAAPTNYGVSIILQNGGQTPTRHMVTNVNQRMFPDEMPADFDFPDSAGRESGICGPGAVYFTGSIDIPAVDLEPMSGTDRHCYVWGWAEYNDVFERTPRHRTEFCFQIVVETILNTNEKIVGFRVHNRFNAADEDCLRQPKA